jgi:multiple sugar transport system permease protein/raffinose/stachyose/melibiose transport system permease protein
MERVLRDRRAIAVFVGPALTVYTLVLLVPIGWSVGYTFYTGSIISGLKPAGWSNYAKVWHDAAFWRATGVTVKYAVAVTIGQVALGLLLSLLYVFYLKRASAVVRTLAFFPVVLPTVAVAQLFVKLFQIAPQNGPVNAVLQGAGLGDSARDWLASPGAAFWILVVMDVWRSMGFYAVLLYAGLVDIPEDIIESARLDGARSWRLFRSIILPLLTPILVSAVIFSINGTLKVFDSVLALTGGGPGDATTPLTLYMYNTAFSYGDYGYGSTIAMALTMMCLAVTLAIFRLSRRDVAA